MVVTLYVHAVYEKYCIHTKAITGRLLLDIFRGTLICFFQSCKSEKHYFENIPLRWMLEERKQAAKFCLFCLCKCAIFGAFEHSSHVCYWQATVTTLQTFSRFLEQQWLYACSKLSHLGSVRHSFTYINDEKCLSIGWCPNIKSRPWIRVCPAFDVTDRNMILPTLWRVNAGAVDSVSSTLEVLRNTHHSWCVWGWCASRRFFLNSPSSQRVWINEATLESLQYLSLRWAAVSEVWGRRLDQRNPPRAAEHKRRVMRRKLIRKFQSSRRRSITMNVNAHTHHLSLAWFHSFTIRDCNPVASHYPRFCPLEVPSLHHCVTELF